MIRSTLDQASRRRAAEILVGAATWVTITAPIWAALIVPHFWVHAFLIFSLYWLYRSGSVALYATLGYKRLTAAQAKDWLGDCRGLLGWQGVQHLVVIPTYREPAALLIETLDHLDAQDFPRQQINILLAFEERDPDAVAKAQLMVDRYSGRFARLWTTFHPDLPGEPRGKGANLAFALPRARDWLLQGGHRDLDRVLVTVCDADSRLHPKYLSALTATALADPHGSHCLYQPAMLFHANIERIPVALRAMDALYSVVQLARLVSTYKLVSQSTYSLSLASCHAIGYWDPDVVPEDSHTYFKMFFKWGTGMRAHPIYLPVLADAAENTTLWKTLLSHYRQARRWAWGVSDVPYVLAQCLTQRHIPWRPRLVQSGHYFKDHLLWPTHWFLLALGVKLLPGDPGSLGLTVWQVELVGLSSAAILASSAFLVFPMLVDRRLRIHHGRARGPAWTWREALAWLALPLLGLPLMVLPALDAHTRLLLGHRLGFNVTRKLTGGTPPLRPVAPVVSLADQQVA